MKVGLPGLCSNLQELLVMEEKCQCHNALGIGGRSPTISRWVATLCGRGVVSETDLFPELVKFLSLPWTDGCFRAYMDATACWVNIIHSVIFLCSRNSWIYGGMSNQQLIFVVARGKVKTCVFMFLITRLTNRGWPLTSGPACKPPIDIWLADGDKAAGLNGCLV